MKLKSIAPLAAYVTVAAGLFWAHSAWVALLGFHTALLLILVIEKPAVPVRALLRGVDVFMLMGCVLLGASGGVVLYLAWPVFSISPNVFANLAAVGLTPAAWPAFIAYFALVNPWLEEYFWRGYLGNTSPKPVVMDFLFAGYHLFILYGKTTGVWMAVSLLVLTLVAWLWRQVSRKSGGLLIACLSHAAADLSILLAVYWMYK